MNARTATTPDEPAERRARHLRQCQELAEIGMELARAAAREALRELETPIEHRMPGMAAPPECPTPEPGILFTRLSRAVRQAILLEARIAAGAYDRPPTLSHPPAHHPATQPQRNRRDSPAPEPHERLEDDLAGEHARSVPKILAGICNEFGLTAEIAQAHDLPPSLFPARPPQAPPVTRPRRPPPRRAPPKPG